MKKNLILIASLLLGSLHAASSAAIDGPQTRKFIQEMVNKHDFDKDELTELFRQTTLQPKIVAAISRPAEGKEWFEYRPIFLTEASIAGGIKFWNEHADTLARASQEYGVPAEIITAIIGVETRYGGNTGSWLVIDALATLAFDYPKRADFFRNELEEYLLLAREEKLDMLNFKGSYAGAMGLAQFIPSSYLDYAVDFDGDGTRDLLHSPDDAIGSVANYFKVHGWKSGQRVALPASVKGDNFSELLESKAKPDTPVSVMKAQGVSIESPLGDDNLANLLDLQGESGTEYWLTLENFYVITRYNHSALYAMAVYQLSQEIREGYENQ